MGCPSWTLIQPRYNNVGAFPLWPQVWLLPGSLHGKEVPKILRQHDLSGDHVWEEADLN